MDELQHWGILGMRWGIRRYQNYDGTYTDAGKKRKRLDIEGESNPELDKHRSDLPSNNPQEKRSNLYANKPVSELTDQELRDFLNRVDMERKYNDYINSMSPKIDPVEKEIKDLRNQLELKNLKNQLNPKQAKKSSPILEVIGPALKSVASQYVKNKLEDVFLKKKEDENSMKKKIDKLRQKVELKDLKSKLAGGENKEDPTSKEIETLRKQVELRDLRNKLNDNKDSTKDEAERAKNEYMIAKYVNDLYAQQQIYDNNMSSALYDEAHNFLTDHRNKRLGLA